MHPYVRRFIAGLEIVGGLGGLGLSFYGALRLIPQWWYAIAAGMMGILFAVSLYAGYHLWHNRKVGCRWSLLLQVLQVPAFSFTGLTYNFYIGGQLGVLFSNFDTRLLWGIGSHLNLNWASQPVSGAVGVNVLALFAAYHLGRSLSPAPGAVSLPVAPPPDLEQDDASA